MRRNQLKLLALMLIVAMFALANTTTAQVSKEKSNPIENTKKGYEIRIRVEGVSDSLCYLANYFGDKQYLKDSVFADKYGNIVFSGDTALKGGIYLIVLPGKKYFEVIVDKEQHFSMSTVEGNYVSAMRISGSKDNVKFYDYLKFISVKTQDIGPLRQEYENFKSTDPARAERVKAQMTIIDSMVLQYRREMIAKNPDFLLSAVLKATEEPEIPNFPPNPDGTRDTSALYYYYKAHFFDNFNLQDDRLLYTPVFHPRLENFFTKMLLQIPDSINKEADWLIAKLKPGSEIFKYVVWWVTNHYETSKIMGMDAVFVHMAENHYTKEKAYWVDETQLFKIQDRARILKPLLVGKKVKNLVMTDYKGTPRSMYDIKAKFTVLYFWDPDCGHCKKVTPKLKEYYDQVKKYGVQVYAVCTEVEIDKWKKFIEEYNLDWINVADPDLKNNFRYEFDISSTPQVFLLDENKQIFAKKIEVETLSEILHNEFKKLEINTPVLPKTDTNQEEKSH